MWRQELVGKVERRHSIPGISAVLGEELKGTELVTLLLDVTRRRAAAVTPADLIAQHQTDRFVAPGQVDFDRLRRAEELSLAALPDSYQRLVLAPLVPLGAHSAVGTTDQYRVVSTIRGSEVAADPTNGLALEAAVRRRQLLDADSRATDEVRLATVQRITRAQYFGGPRQFAHFSVMGFVVAGRDTGSRAFELSAAEELCAISVTALEAAGLSDLRLEVTDLRSGGRVLESIRSGFSDRAEVVAAPDRLSAGYYYTGLAVKALARVGDEWWDLADGGTVDWTQHLVGSRKERLLIGGIGLDRLSLVLG
jgi:hypothetical protein